MEVFFQVNSQILKYFEYLICSLNDGDIYPLIRFFRICVESTLVFLLTMESFYLMAMVNPIPSVLDLSVEHRDAQVRYPVRVRVLLIVTLALLVAHIVESTWPIINDKLFN